MNNRERFIRCAIGEPIDRTPFTYFFGPWGETIEEWKKEGIDNPNAWMDGFGFDPGVIGLAGIVNHLHCPAFVPEIIERRGDILIMQDWLGEIVECVEGREGIPKILRSPVNNREEWEKLKNERLDPHHPDRFPGNWEALIADIKTKDAAVQVGTYPCGLYGTLRDLMGVEGSLFAFYDEPELVKDIMGYLTDFWIAIFEKISSYIQIDVLHIWEDMSGKQGSLISPTLIREFMLPNYLKFKKFADSHGIRILQVDTDGNCEELISLFAEGGINMMLPFEVAAGCDVVSLREKYPFMAMMGGIDKREIAKGKVAIDIELEKIRPLLGRPGYFPALDHLIHPEISYKDYFYFVNSLGKMIFEEQPS